MKSRSLDVLEKYETEESMSRDELFRYFKLYNQGHLEDAYFWNTRITLCGKQKIIDWLYASHQGYLEKLTPVSFIIAPERAAVELEQEFYATEDMSYFLSNQ